MRMASSTSLARFLAVSSTHPSQQAAARIWQGSTLFNRHKSVRAMRKYLQLKGGMFELDVRENDQIQSSKQTELCQSVPGLLYELYSYAYSCAIHSVTENVELPRSL